MAEARVVVGLGVVTPLGLGLAQTAANVRAGLSAAGELDAVDGAYRRVVGCRLAAQHLGLAPVAGVPYQLMELAALAAPAIAEARGACIDELPCRCVVPDGVDGARVVKRLPGLVHRATSHGRAGGLAALAAATAPLELILAVDSLVHPRVLSELEAAGRLRTEAQAEGVVPGQAAVALLVATRAEAERRQLPILAVLAGSGWAQDKAKSTNGEACTGEGLTTALWQALGESGPPVVAWWTTFTGERFFAAELSATQIRIAERTVPSLMPKHAAQALGDSGAAAGLLAVALAISGRARTALVTASSDDGARAAILVAAP